MHKILCAHPLHGASFHRGANEPRRPIIIGSGLLAPERLPPVCIVFLWDIGFRRAVIGFLAVWTLLLCKCFDNLRELGRFLFVIMFWKGWSRGICLDVKSRILWHF